MALNTSELKQWQVDTGYHVRSLSLRCYNTQVSEAYANINPPTNLIYDAVYSCKFFLIWGTNCIIW